MLVTNRSHLVSIQAAKDVNSGINWAGERKGDRILAGEELKLPNEVKEDFADSSKSKGARSRNPLIGPTVARANFEQRLSKSLYGEIVPQTVGGLDGKPMQGPQPQSVAKCFIVKHTVLGWEKTSKCTNQPGKEMDLPVEN